jgi:hypothetical protein
MLSTIGGTSPGVSAFAFNPDAITGGAQITGIPLVTYDIDASGGTRMMCYPNSEASQNDMFNLTSRYKGVFWKSGTRTVAFVGGHGRGPYDYGTAWPTLPLPTGPDPHYVYDPAHGSIGVKGPCAPDLSYSVGNYYYHQIWLVDANHLVQVRQGTLPRSHVQPYEIVYLPAVDRHVIGTTIRGATFDQGQSRLYIAGTWTGAPAIHVYQVT